jgi:hypothetical protein
MTTRTCPIMWTRDVRNPGPRTSRPERVIHASRTACNLFGTTVAGGAYGYGSAFKLTPSKEGWTYTSLHDFTGGSDGSYVARNLIMDANGNLYGVASNSGAGSSFRGCGIVFEITP